MFIKLRQYLYLFFFLFMSSACIAGHSLSLVDNDVRLEIPLEELRSQADTEFTIFAPFRHREVQMKGIFLEDLLQKYLSKIPEHIKFKAIDEYEITFNRWKKKHWLVVTHEDNKPLSVRKQGPLRVVEVDAGGKNTRNLREFNDWVWMLAEIEVLP